MFLEYMQTTDQINIMNIQSALNVILEISETKLDEGSYLEVSNQLKIIFDDNLKKNKTTLRKTIATNRIFTESMIERRPNHLYELTHEEKVMVMRERAREGVESLADTISNVKSDISYAIREKKEAWGLLQHMRLTHSLSLDHYREHHKETVRKEKFLKLALAGFKYEMSEMESLF